MKKDHLSTILKLTVFILYCISVMSEDALECNLAASLCDQEGSQESDAAILWIKSYHGNTSLGNDYREVDMKTGGKMNIANFAVSIIINCPAHSFQMHKSFVPKSDPALTSLCICILVHTRVASDWSTL